MNLATVFNQELKFYRVLLTNSKRLLNFYVLFEAMKIDWNTSSGLSNNLLDKDDTFCDKIYLLSGSGQKKTLSAFSPVSRVYLCRTLQQKPRCYIWYMEPLWHCYVGISVFLSKDGWKAVFEFSGDHFSWSRTDKGDLPIKRLLRTVRSFIYGLFKPSWELKQNAGWTLALMMDTGWCLYNQKYCAR